MFELQVSNQLTNQIYIISMSTNLIDSCQQDPVQMSLHSQTITLTIPNTLKLTFTITNLTLRPVIIYPIISHQDQLFVTNSNTIKILQAFQQFSLTIGLKSISIGINQIICPKLRLYYWQVKNFTDEDEIVLEKEEAMLYDDNNDYQSCAQGLQQQRFIQLVNKCQIRHSIMRKYKSRMFSPGNTSHQIFLKSHNKHFNNNSSPFMLSNYKKGMTLLTSENRNQQQLDDDDDRNCERLSQSSGESVEEVFSPLLYKQYIIEVVVDSNLYIGNNCRIVNTQTKQLYLVQNIIQPEQLSLMSQHEKKQQIQFIQNKLFKQTQKLGKVKAIDRLPPWVISKNNNNSSGEKGRIMERYLIEYKQNVFAKDNKEVSTKLSGDFIEILTAKYYYLFRISKILSYDFNLINHGYYDNQKNKQTISNMRKKLPMIIDLNSVQLPEWKKKKKAIQNTKGRVVQQTVDNDDKNLSEKLQQTGQNRRQVVYNVGIGQLVKQEKQLVVDRQQQSQTVVNINRNDNIVSSEVGVAVVENDAVVVIIKSSQRQYQPQQQQELLYINEQLLLQQKPQIITTQTNTKNQQLQPSSIQLQQQQKSRLQHQKSHQQQPQQDQYLYQLGQKQRYSLAQGQQQLQQHQLYESQLMQHYNNLQHELLTHQEQQQLQTQTMSLPQQQQQSPIIVDTANILEPKQIKQQKQQQQKYQVVKQTSSQQLPPVNVISPEIPLIQKLSQQQANSTTITTSSNNKLKQLISHRHAHHYDNEYHSRESLQKLSFLEQQQLTINNSSVVVKVQTNTNNSQLNNTSSPTQYIDQLITYAQPVLACYIYHNSSSSTSQKQHIQPTAYLLFRTHLMYFPLANPQLQTIIKLDPLNQSDTVNCKTILTPYINKSSSSLQQLILANGCYIYWISLTHKQSQWKYCQRKEIYSLQVIQQMGLLIVGGKNFSKLSYFGKQTSRSNIKIYTCGKPSHRNHLFTYDIPINDGNVGNVVEMKYITTPPAGGKILCAYTNYNDQFRRIIFLRIRAYNAIEIYGNIQLSQIGIQSILSMKYNPKSMKLLILQQVDTQHTALKRLKVKTMYEKVQVLTECIKTELGNYSCFEIGGDKQVQWYSLIKKDKSSALIYRANKFHNNPQLIELKKYDIESVYDIEYGGYVFVKGRDFVVIKRKKKRIHQNFK